MRPNYFPIAFKTLIAIVALLFGDIAYAANWYVRPSSAGSGSGADWNNAWSLSSIAWGNIKPGDTIWLAGGKYNSGLTIGANGASGNPISIYRVRSTDSAPTAAAGWNASFDSTVDIGGITVPHNSYVTIDGRIPFVLSTSGLTKAGMTIEIPISGGDGIDGSSVTSGGLTSIVFNNISITGPYASTSNPAGGAGITGINIAQTPNGNITGCIFHGISIVGTGEALRSSNWVNCVVEYCYIADTANDGQQHEDVVYTYPSAQNCTWRYNYINNSPNDGLFFEFGGAVDFYFYGNVYYNSNAGMFGTKAPGNYGPLYIYNNVFMSTDTSGQANLGFTGTVNPATQIYNNIFYNVANATGQGGPVQSDYNAYNYTNLNGYSWPSSETHSITFTGNPFVYIPSATEPVGSTGANFQLTAAVQAQFQKGIPLAADGFINKDMLGDTRSVSGAWYIGAYQYGGSGAPAAPTNLRISSN